jgi:hypothetical protein
VWHIQTVYQQDISSDKTWQQKDQTNLKQRYTQHIDNTED